jgi:hydroxymethylpyrimidine/phosphomethylpyrimidine kinase
VEQLTPVVAAVGTTHPLNIAGVGLDARIAPLLGIRVVTIVAGVSAQSADRIFARAPVDPAIISAQFAALHDAQPAAVHVGALLDAASVGAIAGGLASLGRLPVVCDPVSATTDGGRLADDATLAALRDTLFAYCTLVTPNLAEAALLTGTPVDDIPAMETAARALRSTGAQAVLIKGGHLGEKPTDVLASADGITHFRAARIPGSLRGTGDLLACAIAARLAAGADLHASIDAARAFVRGCLAAGVPFAGARTVP